jgi:CRISPR-associated protein Csm4
MANDLYKLTLTPTSPFLTPFHSDTLFGHICWALRHLKGGHYLENSFLQAFQKKAEPPPLLLSDGFPQGMLPKPVWVPLAKKYIMQNFRDRKIDNFRASQLLKRIKKTSFISFALFQSLQARLSSRALFEMLLDASLESSAALADKPGCRAATFHNTVNRLSGTVTEGLFTQTETFYPANYKVDVYLRSHMLSKQELLEIFRFIGLHGYGGDASTGKGRFDVGQQDIVDFTFLQVDAANGFMSLSSFVPDQRTPTTGYYDLLVKYGKLGGGFGAVFKGVRSPFKYPIIMLKSGAVFHGYDSAYSYGALLDDVHQNKQIKHYAYAFPIPVKIVE